MLMDPKVWGDPGAFRPERFLSSEAESLPNPLVVITGFGMRHVVLTARFLVLLITIWDRACPGRYLADRNGFHISAKLVAAFDIAPAPGKDRPKPELVEYTDTAFRRVFPLRIYQGISDRPCRLPVGFECHFVPRDTRSLELLKGLSLED
jgi:hypothetical protein